MSKKKLLKKILSGLKNISFTEVMNCAKAFGFHLDRVHGSHHILIHPELPELLNLQNVNGKAKPYQINQMLKIIEKYNLHLEDE